MEAPHLAEARTADASTVAEIYLASRADALPYLPKVHTDAETRAWVADELMSRCRVFLARIGREAIGFFALNGAELEQLYLRPGWYRRGIGSRLLEQAKRESPGRLELWAFQRNTRARAFYEAHGFRAVAFTDGADNEEREPDVRYVWETTPAS